MFRRKTPSFIIFILFSLLIISFTTNAYAGPYSGGHVWDRNTEYTTASNPGVDLVGNAVWSYEYFTGMNYDTTTLFTQVASWGPRWEHGPMNISGWDQNTNYDSGWNTSLETSMIRWTNPVGDGVNVDFDGHLTMFWGGDDSWRLPGFNASPVDVQMVMGYHDASENQITLLMDELITAPFSGEVFCANFGDCPQVQIPLNYSLSMDIGDSFFWTAITLGQVNANRWVTLNDNPMSISLASVPEPTTMLLFGTGIIGLAGLKRKRKKN